MFCPKCGTRLTTQSNYCPECGYKLTNMANENSRAKESEKSEISYSYDTSLNTESILGESSTTSLPKKKSDIAACLLAIFLGYFGIHNFYLRRYSNAVVQLLLTVFGILGIRILAPTVGINSSTFGIINETLSLFALGYVTIWIIIDIVRICINKINTPDNIELIQHAYTKFVALIIFAIIIILNVSKVYKTIQNENPIVVSIREAEYVNNITYDDLITALIANPVWEKINDNTVNVSGDIIYNGEHVNLAVGLKIDDQDNISIYAMELNRTPLDAKTRLAILSRMYTIATSDQLQH